MEQQALSIQHVINVLREMMQTHRDCGSGERQAELMVRLQQSVDTLEQVQRKQVRLVELFRDHTHGMVNELQHMLRGVEMLEASVSQAAERQALDMIVSSLDKVGITANQLLERARSEWRTFSAAGTLRPAVAAEPAQTLEIFDLVELVDDVIWVKQQQLRNEVNIRFDRPPKTAYIRADISSIEMILDEIINNAARYVDNQGNGEIRLRIQNNQVQVVLEVEDNGRGIGVEDRPRILNTSFVGKGGHTGQGLAIVRRTMEKMRGSITLNWSEIGSGSCFKLQFQRPLTSERLHRADVNSSRVGRRHGSLRHERTDVEYRLYGAIQLGPYQSYKALHPDGTECWIKLAPVGPEGEPAALLLRKEVDMLTLLQHKHLARLLERGTALRSTGQRHRFMRLEAVPGVPLDQILPHESLYIDDALQIALHMADLLVYLHANGVVCRSLSPTTIYSDGQFTTLVDLSEAFFDYDQEVQALAGAQAAAPVQPVSPQVVWNRQNAHEPSRDLRYIAPEHYNGFTPDRRSDIYAYGVLLFELLTGTPLFGTDNHEDAVMEKRLQPLPRPRDVRQDIPPELEQIVLRCLERLPLRRYPNAEMLHQDIQAIKVVREAEEQSGDG